MANQQALSDEEVQLRRRARRRLIGAITLVTVMVVTLPWVLDGEPKQSGQQDIVIDIPPQNSGKEFSSKIVPVPEQPITKRAQEPAPAVVQAEKSSPAHASVAPTAPQSQLMEKKAEAQSAKVEEKKSEAPPDDQTAKAVEPAGKKPAAAAAEAPPKEKRKDEKSAAAKQDGGPFVIQLGAFANLANAKERQAKLAALKIKFYTETVKTPSGDKLRVRAGPYATRQEAERVQAKLKASGIQDGVVAEKKG